MERSFGIELEIAGITRATAATALHAINVAVRDEGYNHDTREHWKLVSDGSVSGGFEVVSPVLRGEAGLREAMAVAEALADAGATVNRTCGFHVHFDARQMSVADIKVIMRRYAAYESEIDAVMPVSRRAANNRFCRSLNESRLSRILAADTVADMAQAQPSRYFKINLQAFQRHGTIEFRQHSGTVNARKIGNWVCFLAAFIDESQRIAASATQPVAEPVIANPALHGVQARLAAMFTAQGTVTLRSISTAFGWLDKTSRAAVARLRQAGLQIQAVRVNGEAAYRLISGVVSAPVQQPADSLWAGVEQAVVEFYRRRAAVLAVVAA